MPDCESLARGWRLRWPRAEALRPLAPNHPEAQFAGRKVGLGGVSESTRVVAVVVLRGALCHGLGACDDFVLGHGAEVGEYVLQGAQP